MSIRKKRLERKKMRKLFPGDKNNTLKYDSTTLTREEALDLISTVHRSCIGPEDYYRKANSMLRSTERIRRRPEWEYYMKELDDRRRVQGY